MRLHVVQGVRHRRLVEVVHRDSIVREIHVLICCLLDVFHVLADHLVHLHYVGVGVAEDFIGVNFAI